MNTSPVIVANRPRPRLLAVLLLAVLAVAACTTESATVTPTQTATEPAPTDTATATEATPTGEPTGAAVDLLRFATSTGEQNLTPWTQGSGYPGYYMMTLIYDTLLWTDPDGEPQPWLAEEVTVNDDGTEWTVTLRDGVAFHDGEALTSEDVAFTIEYLKAHPRPRFTPPLEPITEVDTPDERTVVLTLSEPRASFARNPLADLPIIPEHVWSGIDDPDAVTEDLPIGSGPYRLTEYTQEQVWRFEANPDYFLGAPTVAEIVMPFVADEQAALTALQAGEVDAVTATLTPELVEQFQAADGIEVIQAPGFRGFYLYINTARPPFDQVEARQALVASVDLNEIVDTVLLGSGTVGSPGFVHREAPWANPDTVDQEQDVEAARTLLDDLGLEDADDDGIREGADGQPLAFEVIVDSDDAIAVRAVELIAEAAAEIGLELSPLALDPQSAGSRIWPDEAVGQFEGDYTLGNHSWAGVVQTDFSFLRSLFHSDPTIGTLNRSAYDNADYDALADEMVRAVDDAEREDLLFQLQEILATDLPALPLYFPDDNVPYRPATFDDWTYYPGAGILNKAAFVSP